MEKTANMKYCLLSFLCSICFIYRIFYIENLYIFHKILCKYFAFILGRMGKYLLSNLFSFSLICLCFPHWHLHLNEFHQKLKQHIPNNHSRNIQLESCKLIYHMAYLFQPHIPQHNRQFI